MSPAQVEIVIRDIFAAGTNSSKVYSSAKLAADHCQDMVDRSLEGIGMALARSRIKMCLIQHVVCGGNIGGIFEIGRARILYLWAF